MDFKEIYQMAFRSSTGINDLKRIAETELCKFNGKQKVKLVEALLFNSNVCNCVEEIGKLVMEDLFEKEGIYQFKLPQIESILSNIISCGYSEVFVEYMKDYDPRLRDDEWYEVAEKYNLLEAEYCYENETVPFLIDFY